MCLTVTALRGAGFTADVMPETVRRTTLGDRRPGDALNLERAMTLRSRLGGHLVAGHIDGVGEVARVVPEGNALIVDIEAPEAVWSVSVPQGSVAIDGVSLTIVAVDGARLRVSLIPHTAAVTTLSRLAPGVRVDLRGGPHRQVCQRVRLRPQAGGRAHLGEASGSGVLMDRTEERTERPTAGGNVFADIEDALDDLRAGKFVIVVDDEDRENEGDLTIAADKVTPQAINFMATYGRGLICLAMTRQRLDEFALPAHGAPEQQHGALARRSPSRSTRATASPPASRPTTAPTRCR